MADRKDLADIHPAIRRSWTISGFSLPRRRIDLVESQVFLTPTVWVQTWSSTSPFARSRRSGELLPQVPGWNLLSNHHQHRFSLPKSWLGFFRGWLNPMGSILQPF